MVHVLFRPRRLCHDDVSTDDWTAGDLVSRNNWTIWGGGNIISEEGRERGMHDACAVFERGAVFDGRRGLKKGALAQGCAYAQKGGSLLHHTKEPV